LERGRELMSLRN